MSRHIAIAVLHGMGSEVEHYSVELKHRVTESYLAGGKDRADDDLIWQEIYWGDLLREQHLQLFRAVNYRHDLAYPNLREWILDYMSTALQYRADTALYSQIHQRVQAQLTRLAHHRRIDAAGSPLVILAHSMGAVIAAHYINDIRAGRWAKALPKNTVATPFESVQTLCGFISFGSPQAIWAAQACEPPFPIGGSALSDKLQSRARWYNFYDKDDIIAYPLKGLGEPYASAVHDEFEINVGSATTSWNPACHNGYWEDPDFYKPVAKYLGEIHAAL